MIKVLIVEDNDEKLNKVSKELLTEFEGNVEIDTVKTVINAKQHLISELYDLLIIDLNIPLREGEEARDDAGFELYREIDSLNLYKRPNEIVFYTSHLELKKKYEKEIKQRLFSIVEYSLTSEEWLQSIFEKVHHMLKVKYDMDLDNQKYDYDVAIITAVDVEHESIVKLVSAYKKITVSGDHSLYYTGTISSDGKKLRVVFAKQTQMGMTAATSLSMKLINNFKPKYLCMTGIAAGKKGKGKLGDIIAATQVWDYSAGKLATNKTESKGSLFMPSPNYLSVDVDTVNKYQQSFTKVLSKIKDNWTYTKIETSLNLLIGPLACGPAVIQDEALVKDYIDPHNRDFKGIDMESYGVLYAAANSKLPRPKTLILKSICDYADSEKNDDFQTYAAYTSSSFLAHFLLNEAEFVS